MFTGLVTMMPRVLKVVPAEPGRRLTLEFDNLDGPLQLGESIALNGCCLTVVAFDDNIADFEAGPETLQKTNLGALEKDHRVNAERALALGERLGGHMVQGHVDGTATLQKIVDQDDWKTYWFELDQTLARQLVPKGSITVDGVSLTVVEANPNAFSVALIPHTLAHTTLGELSPQSRVNIETDIMGKYIINYLSQLDLSRWKTSQE